MVQTSKRVRRSRALGLPLLLAACLGNAMGAADAASSSSSGLVSLPGRWVRSCLPYQVLDIGYQMTCLTAQALAATRGQGDRAFAMTVVEFERRYRAHVEREGGPLLEGCAP